MSSVKWFLSVLVLATVCAGAEAQPKAEKAFPRGLKRSPAHRILAAPKFQATAAPAAFATVPPKLMMWGNDTYGDCVSAEEAFALAAWTYRCTGTEVVPTNAEVVAFATKYGYRDGATLTDVMDTMQTHGMVVGGKTYKTGPYSTVDYTSSVTLQSAIFSGPVNIAIDADALPPGAGNQQGWYRISGGNYPNTDHCVSLPGYGSASFLYSSLGVPLPAGLTADTQGYLLYTWSTIGFVTQTWINSTCQEAYVRVPTTVGFSPPTPPTPPVPPNPPTPPTPPGPAPVGFTGSVTYVWQNGVVVNVVVTPGAAPVPPPVPTPDPQPTPAPDPGTCGVGSSAAYTIPISTMRAVTYQPAAYSRPRLFNLGRR